jgi:serine/threonine protein kinase
MSSQSSIAHYRIVSQVGEGGMGAVYRATFAKLNRDAAIKILPDALANDPDCRDNCLLFGADALPRVGKSASYPVRAARHPGLPRTGETRWRYPATTETRERRETCVKYC